MTESSALRNFQCIYQFCDFYLELFGPYGAIVRASENPEIKKQGTTAGKRKHISLKIPQKLQIISRLESGKS